MKRKIILLSSAAIACLIGGTVSLTACGGNPADNAGVFGPYIYPEKEIVTDSNVRFDGEIAANESIWQNAVWHEMKSVKANRGLSSTMTLANCDVRATIVTKENGLYIGFETNDPIIYVGEMPIDSLNPDYMINAFAKSGFSIYLTYKTGDELIGNEPAYEIGFAADGTYTMRYNEKDGAYWMGNEYTAWGNPDIVAASRVKGTLNTDGNDGYSIEAYIPWNSLPSLKDVSPENYPKEVTAAFAMERFTGVGADKIQTWEMLNKAGGQEQIFVHTWDTYSSNGYVARPQGAVFGNYGENVYDSGFDLSGDVGNNGEVSFKSNLRRESYLYVRNQKSDTQFAEVRFQVGEKNTHGFWNNPIAANTENGLYDNQPMMGLFFRGDVTADATNRQHVYTFYSGVDVFQTEDTTEYDRRKFAFAFTSDSDNDHYFLNADGGFSSCGEIPCNFKSGHDFKLTVIRERNTFYTYINDCFMSKRTSANIAADAETYMGLFVLNTSITVSDYAFFSGSDAETKIGEYLAVRAGDTFTAVKSDGETRLSVGDADLINDTTAAKKAVISATLNQQIEARVKNVPGNSNKVYAEYTLKYKEKPTMGYGRVTLALTNADGDVVYFGFQAPNTTNIEMLKSWSTRGGVYNWNEPDSATTVAHHGNTKNMLTYQQIDDLYKGEGLKITVYGDGEKYYFFADGKPIYCWANNGTYIRSMEGTGDGCLNVSLANITAVSVGVDCQSVEINDYTFAFGADATAAYEEAFGLRGETFTAKDFSGAYNALVNASNDKGANPSLNMSVPAGSQGVATVNDSVSGETKLFAEFTVKLNNTDAATAGRYVTLAIVAENGKAVHFAFQVNIAGNIDDIRSWTTESGGVMLNWEEAPSGYNYAVHMKDADTAGMTTALKGDGLKVSVYRDENSWHFYLNGEAVNTHATSSHIREIELGETNIAKIGIAVNNADVTVSGYSFLFGSEAETAHTNAGFDGCGSN